MPYMRHVHSTKAKPFRKRQTHQSSERILDKDYDRKVSVKKSLVVNLKGLGGKTN
jgi:hypothetical protein